MNPWDESWQRLFRAAARAPVEEPGALPAGLEARVLARWRSVDAEPELEWVGVWFRRGLAAACTVMVLSLVWNWTMPAGRSSDDPASVNDVIQEAVTP